MLQQTPSLILFSYFFFSMPQIKGIRQYFFSISFLPPSVSDIAGPQVESLPS
jgi:hypothetical protein